MTKQGLQISAGLLGMAIIGVTFALLANRAADREEAAQGDKTPIVLAQPEPAPQAATEQIRTAQRKVAGGKPYPVKCVGTTGFFKDDSGTWHNINDAYGCTAQK